jgi:methanogenic corrinoid protein MtbC1
MRDLVEKLKRSLLDLDRDGTLESVRALIEGDGQKGAEAAVEALSEALRVVGKRFQDGTWFLSDLVYSGEIGKAAMELVSPLLAAGATRKRGTIVVGTVAGDLHDLGKNIFASYAKSAGFEIVDLGSDVPKDRFVGAVGEHSALALGLSCLLTITAREVGGVIEELKRRGIRDEVKVIIGGAALTEQFASDVGADAFAPDAVTGTDIVKEWSAERGRC